MAVSFLPLQTQSYVITGLKYRNFTNSQGALADGTCCDNPGLTPPNCPPDQCDTIFSPCATYVGGKQCGAYFQTLTPVMADVDSFELGNKIGNIKGNDIFNVVAFLDSFAPENIHFNILALEVNLNDTQLIANFSFVIDWIDTFFSENDHWRQMVLRDKDVELGLDVVHQCRKYRFGRTCSVYCKPTHQYTCLSDGSKNCTDGWQGPHCTDLVPYCTSGSCLNGGTCTNIHLGFNCSCTSSHSGEQCEHKDLTTTSSSLISLITAPSPATAQPSTSTKFYTALAISNTPTILFSKGSTVLLGASDKTLSTSKMPTSTSSSLISLITAPSSSTSKPSTSSKFYSTLAISNTPTILFSKGSTVLLGASDKTLSTSKMPTSTSSSLISLITAPSSSTSKPSTSSKFYSTLAISNTPTILFSKGSTVLLGTSDKTLSTSKMPTSTSSSLISLITAPPTSTSKPSTSSKFYSTLAISNTHTILSSKGPTVLLSTSDKTLSTSKTPISNQTHSSNSRNLTTVVATSVSVGLFVLGVLFAATTYLMNKMKKQWFRRGRVQPSLSPPQSRKESQAQAST